MENLWQLIESLHELHDEWFYQENSSLCWLKALALKPNCPLKICETFVCWHIFNCSISVKLLALVCYSVYNNGNGQLLVG